MARNMISWNGRTTDNWWHVFQGQHSLHSSGSNHKRMTWLKHRQVVRLSFSVSDCTMPLFRTVDVSVWYFKELFNYFLTDVSHFSCVLCRHIFNSWRNTHLPLFQGSSWRGLTTILLQLPLESRSQVLVIAHPQLRPLLMLIAQGLVSGCLQGHRQLSLIGVLSLHLSFQQKA